VEDNDADVYLFRKALEGAGVNFELTVIEDGAEALAFVEGEGPVPHLAVLDLNLRKRDGAQVLEVIRASRRFASTPWSLPARRRRRRPLCAGRTHAWPTIS